MRQHGYSHTRSIVKHGLLAGASEPTVPVMGAVMQNELPYQTASLNDATRPEILNTITFTLGSGDYSEIYLSCNNWYFDRTDITAGLSRYKLKEVWIIAESGEKHQVTFDSGSTSKIVEVGDNDVRSDAITADDLGVVLESGLTFSIKVRFVLVDGSGATLTAGAYPSAPGTGGGITSGFGGLRQSEDGYTSANLQTFGGLAFETGVSTAGSLPLLVIGKASEKTLPAYLFVGDSITSNTNDTSAGGSPWYSRCYSGRSMLDDSASPTLHRAGFKFAKGGATAADIVDNPDLTDKLAYWSTFSDVLFEKMGANGFNLAEKSAIWDTFRNSTRQAGTPAPVVVGLGGGPNTDSSDGWTTLGGQSNPIGVSEANEASLLAQVGIGIDYAVLLPSSRAATSGTDFDYWDSPSGTALTDDGLHPNPRGHELVAGDLRAWLNSYEAGL